MDIHEWYSDSVGYGKTVYVISTKPITNISWYSSASSSSSN